MDSRPRLAAAVGALATAIGAFGLSEFVGGDWADTERDAAIVGAGAVALLGVANLAQAALPAGAAPPQLPPATPQTFQATEAQSAYQQALEEQTSMNSFYASLIGAGAGAGGNILASAIGKSYPSGTQANTQATASG